MGREEEFAGKSREDRHGDAAVPESEKASLDLPEFNRLDNLLNQTQLYSEFLLQKMDSMSFGQAKAEAAAEAEAAVAEQKKTGRGLKRKCSLPPRKPRACQKNGTYSKEGLLSECKLQENANGGGGGSGEREPVTEEERLLRDQRELVPLLTGGQLKSYQLKGVKWLISLWQNGLNGILADQMGLGKTIQAIGLLAHLKGQGMHGPFLVCAPLSTLSNWMQEVKRWVPELPAVLYHGTKEERAELRRTLPLTISSAFPVFITSYEVCINDRKFLCRRRWKYIIVDEGHRLKNFDCKLIRELRQIPTDNTLLLTGTPLQNNLSELWSLLNFILPDTFASLHQFESWFDFSGKGAEGDTAKGEEQRRAEVITKLHRILRPFLLRRVKSEVEKNLPLKKEIILYAPMTPHQMKLQELLINNTINEHFRAKNGSNAYRSKLNNLMMQLRKNANHPDLLSSHFDDAFDYPPVEDLLEQCGKLQLLQRLLIHLRQRGHKILIFSQMTRMMDIIEYFLQASGVDPDPCRIDGSVKLAVRQAQIAEFNSDRHERYIFLLSTRAGGLGINLTAADTVIIYDSDWNPHMDMQAMDRCHRIGQEKPVHVYRLLSAHSIECRMLKVARRKMQLEHVVIERGQFKQERTESAAAALDETDLLLLLRQEQNKEEEHVQSAEISDVMLLKMFDRTDLLIGNRLPPNARMAVAPLLPPRGPGWEVVTRSVSDRTLLSSIEPQPAVKDAASTP